MLVFVSWSGPRSKILAEEVSDLLRRLLHPIRPWMSAKSLEKGDRWLREIGDKLSQVSRGIICVTPENQSSPWLLFEAGALSKSIDHGRVCPLVMGMGLDDLKPPLSQFQATTLHRDDVLQLLSAFNSDLRSSSLDPRLLEEEFDEKWPKFQTRLNKRLKGIVISSRESMDGVLDALKTNGVAKPEHGVTVHFRDGFESHGLYAAVTCATKRRLLIFGRKNRKLFDKEHTAFFHGLKSRIQAGFDFRCLFLSPKAATPIVTNAHEDADFAKQLKTCIRTAVRMFRQAGIEPDDVMKGYSVGREAASVVADDAVLFTPIQHTVAGRAAPLTRCGFTMTDTSTALGSMILSDFDNVWAGASSITD